jgi:hypothetical protein
MDNFIREYPNDLSEEFCLHVIDKFERDPIKVQGYTARGVETSIKRSTDLLISNHLHWKEEDSAFRSSLTKALEVYYHDVIKSCYQYVGNTLDTGYNIQRTKPGEFYGWHNDAAAQQMNGGTYMRIFTFLWYLNDVTEGGETEFIDGTKIKPEAGKLLLFPATWVHAHQGVTPVSNTKYICTGWVHELY